MTIHPKVLVTLGMPGAPYPTQPSEGTTDEAVAAMIQPTIDRACMHPSVPPVKLLVWAYRHAWAHYRGPRRRKHQPNTNARGWALSEVGRLVTAWVSRRPDPTGAWKQHAHLADWPNQRVLVELDGPEPAYPDQIAMRRDALIATEAMKDAQTQAQKVLGERYRSMRRDGVTWVVAYTDDDGETVEARGDDLALLLASAAESKPAEAPSADAPSAPVLPEGANPVPEPVVAPKVDGRTREGRALRQRMAGHAHPE